MTTCATEPLDMLVRRGGQLPDVASVDAGGKSDEYWRYVVCGPTLFPAAERGQS